MVLASSSGNALKLKWQCVSPNIKCVFFKCMTFYATWTTMSMDEAPEIPRCDALIMWSTLKTWKNCGVDTFLHDFCCAQKNATDASISKIQCPSVTSWVEICDIVWRLLHDCMSFTIHTSLISWNQSTWYFVMTSESWSAPPPWKNPWSSKSYMIGLPFLSAPRWPLR